MNHFLSANESQEEKEIERVCGDLRDRYTSR